VQMNARQSIQSLISVNKFASFELNATSNLFLFYQAENNQMTETRTEVLQSTVDVLHSGIRLRSFKIRLLG
jgi:hypothetical protein